MCKTFPLWFPVQAETQGRRRPVGLKADHCDLEAVGDKHLQAALLQLAQELGPAGFVFLGTFTHRHNLQVGALRHADRHQRPDVLHLAAPARAPADGSSSVGWSSASAAAHRKNIRTAHPAAARATRRSCRRSSGSESMRKILRYRLDTKAPERFRDHTLDLERKADLVTHPVWPADAERGCREL